MTVATMLGRLACSCNMPGPCTSEAQRLTPAILRIMTVTQAREALRYSLIRAHLKAAPININPPVAKQLVAAGERKLNNDVAYASAILAPAPNDVRSPLKLIYTTTSTTKILTMQTTHKHVISKRVGDVVNDDARVDPLGFGRTQTHLKRRAAGEPLPVPIARRLDYDSPPPPPPRAPV